MVRDAFTLFLLKGLHEVVEKEINQYRVDSILCSDRSLVGIFN